MANLTVDELAQIRQPALQSLTVTSDKPTINAAIQALEDWWAANAGALNNAVNAATAPIVLPMPIKKALLVFWLFSKYGRGG